MRSCQFGTNKQGTKYYNSYIVILSLLALIQVVDIAVNLYQLGVKHLGDLAKPFGRIAGADPDIGNVLGHASFTLRLHFGRSLRFLSLGSGDAILYVHIIMFIQTYKETDKKNIIE